MVSELTQTDTIIAPYVVANRFMFRAPFGAYDANVYGALQASPMSKYVGHIDWEVGGQRTATTAADWACWQTAPQLTAKACGDLYIQEIDAVGKGIVLMHDADYGQTANNDPNAGTGNTVIMVKYMVPLLKAKGYTFVRVDEVPEIAALLPPLPPPPADAGTDGDAPPPPPTPTTTTPPPPCP
jgi:peptidoglycan/xylan/chitin deacetylase (PgdA/CDA1 family)